MLVYSIDFGTSNSLLGAADESGVRDFAPLDPDAPDPTVLRSLLYFPSANQVFYGAKAILEFAARDHTGRFIRSVKRQLPRRSFIGTYVDNRPFNLEDLIGTFLGEMRRRANAFYGQEVDRVVLGRPARFSMDEADDQYAQNRLERAARVAGFREIQFFPEPVAAALGYRAEASSAKESLVLAADYGGGTSDFTVYRLGKGGFSVTDVIAIGGVAVAGDALDAALMRNRISSHFGTGVQYRVPFGSNTLTMPTNLMERICHPAEISLLRQQDTYEFLRNVKEWSLGPQDRTKMDNLFTLLNDQLGFPLFEKIEATKRTLSSSDHALFDFSYPGLKITEEVTRPQFEKYAEGPLRKIEESLAETLASAQVDPARIDRVLFTGGTGRVHAIRSALERRFGKEKLFDLDPFRGVAHGLRQRASELARK